MPTFDALKLVYGAPPLGRQDIRQAQCVVFDLRAETGGGAGPRAVLVDPPHCYNRALFMPSPGELPTAEIVLDYGGQTVHLVAEPTGRPRAELTPEQLQAMGDHADYREQMLAWLSRWRAA